MKQKPLLACTELSAAGLSFSNRALDNSKNEGNMILSFPDRQMKQTEKHLEELKKKFPTAPEYLTEILLIQRDYGTVSNTRLSERIGVSKPAVTQAIKRLKRLGFVNQDLYGSIEMTPQGRILAAGMLKRHYLIEHMLIHCLDFPWEKSDDEARRLQDDISEALTSHLYSWFGEPDTCPHGNPLPGTLREKELLNAPRITDAPVDQDLELVRITEEGEAIEGLLKFCHTHLLHPGKVFTVAGKSENVGVSIQCCGEDAFEMPWEFAKYLCYIRKATD